MVQNTKEKVEYILEHLLWTVIAMLWYRASLFRPIRGLTYRQSVLALWGGIIIFSLIGITYSMKQQIVISCSIGLFLFISYAVFIFTRRVRNKRKYKKILKMKMRKSIECFRWNIGLAMLVIMLLGGARYFQTGNVFSNIKTVNSYGEEYNIDHNIETIARSDKRFWKDLDFNMKLEAAQVLANCEANYLGIDHEIKI